MERFYQNSARMGRLIPSDVVCDTRQDPLSIESVRPRVGRYRIAKSRLLDRDFVLQAGQYKSRLVCPCL